ncbi:Translin-1 [Podospora fimiseda]|uniref:Translin-1 n=1 Tax=Podospora fimiseda TaxID=252190 RepID=A0AAN7BKP2_9PEZI|nr:Translin-1 [Podospora fimiseda]
MAPPMIDPALFDQLRSNIEQDTTVRKELDQIVDDLNQDVAFTQGLLSRIHSTPRFKYQSLFTQVEPALTKQTATISKLSNFASQYPYYKYNHKYTRTLQEAITNLLLSTWLGAPSFSPTPLTPGHLLTLDAVGSHLQVPVNLKSGQEDKFHITIEEYLLALINVIDELSRLAMNSVTLGDTALAVQISGFIKDLHAGFQVLNLKNDILRKRVDSIKYAVKKAEDIVYDLSLRNLIPKKEVAEEEGHDVKTE